MILIPTSPMEFKINLCILSISLFLVGCIIASLIPYQILEYESGKIWLLFSSAVSKKEIALGKSIFTAMSYLLYALPIGIIASILNTERFASYLCLIWPPNIVYSVIIINIHGISTDLCRCKNDKIIPL